MQFLQTSIMRTPSIILADTWGGPEGVRLVEVSMYYFQYQFLSIEGLPAQKLSTVKNL